MTTTDISLDELDVPTQQEVRRDQWGRYKVLGPDGKKPQGYIRSTTVAKTLDDTSNLMDWACRMTSLGLAARPDLLSAIAATDKDDKKALNALVERAKEAGGGTVRRDQGTTLHAILEHHWTEPGYTVPAIHAADVLAVDKALAANNLEPMAGFHEAMIVRDDHTIGGMFDLGLRDTQTGTLYVGDVKTGSSVQYGALAWAVQLSTYAGADAVYTQGAAADGSQDSRAPLPNFDRDLAVIIHVEPGSGVCHLYWLNIAVGEQGLALAMAVREIRKTKNVLVPIVAPTPSVDASALSLDDPPVTGQVDASNPPLDVPASTEPVTGDPSDAGGEPFGDGGSGSLPLGSTSSVVTSDQLIEAAFPGVVHIDTYGTLKTRALIIKAHDAEGLATLAHYWPDEVPTFGQCSEFTAEQADLVHVAVSVVESKLRVPFPAWPAIDAATPMVETVSTVGKPELTVPADHPLIPKLQAMLAALPSDLAAKVSASYAELKAPKLSSGLATRSQVARAAVLLRRAVREYRVRSSALWAACGEISDPRFAVEHFELTNGPMKRWTGDQACIFIALADERLAVGPEGIATTAEGFRYLDLIGKRPAVTRGKAIATRLGLPVPKKFADLEGQVLNLVAAGVER